MRWRSTESPSLKPWRLQTVEAATSPCHATIAARRTLSIFVREQTTGPAVQLKTLAWAQGLRASLATEIEAVLARGVSTSHDAERLMMYRQQLGHVEILLAALQNEMSQRTLDKDPAR